MKYGIVLLMLLLAGCVSTGNGNNDNNSSTGRTSARIHTELAGLYFERAQLGTALSEIGTALQADSNYAPAYNVRGLIHMTLREDKEAEADFQRSLQLDKEDSETHNNYGWFLCQRLRPTESIPHFLVALKNPLYTTPERAYLNAGVCSQKAGNYQDAQDFLQRALTIRPGLPQALLGMAEVSFFQGAFHTAQRYFGEFSAKSDGLSADNLLLAVRINRAVGDRNVEATYAAQLRQNYPDSNQARLLNTLNR
jgi:type IV pilus assembly protein PilF